MLAVIKPPRMGSSQPPDGLTPFGFVFDEPYDLPEPPQPPPGADLFSESDMRVLHSFFEGFDSNSFDISSLAQDEGLNFSNDWLQLPPQLVGTTTSFGQQPQGVMGSHSQDVGVEHFRDSDPFTSSMMPPPPPPSASHHLSHTRVEQTSHADAAGILTALQNSHASRPNRGSPNHVIPAQAMAAPSEPITFLPNPFQPEPRSPTRRSNGDEHSSTFADMMFGGSSGSNQSPRESAAPLMWGSDSSFGQPQGFVPKSNRESSVALERERMRYVDCLAIKKSNSSTGPPSPIGHGAEGTNGVRNGESGRLIKLEEDPDGPARKRRKSKPYEEADDEDSSPANHASKAAAARKRRSKVDFNEPANAIPSVQDAGKRRKSTNNGAKPPRENLSEEQKRENHIKSEQRRRTLIKEGFEDLVDIVPNLKTGGYSKSTMLQHAGEWLEALLIGNKALREELGV